MMRRVIVLAFVFACAMLASVETASALECRVVVSGNQKDVFNNTVWSSGGTGYYVGDRNDPWTCLADGQYVLNLVARDVCLNRRSAVNINMLGSVYFDGSFVNGWWAPASCRTAWGLNYYTTLAPGGRLNPGDSVFSWNGDYELIYQTDANLVFYQGSTALWAINCMPTCNNLGNAGYAEMQTDGNFVAYDDTNNAVWDSSTYGANGSFLAIRNGELLMFSTSGSVIWQAP